LLTYGPVSAIVGNLVTWGATDGGTLLDSGVTLDNLARRDGTLAQTGAIFWTNRAEIGLDGSENLRFRVSADGVSWWDAITIGKSTGAVQLLGGTVAAPALTFFNTTTGFYRIGNSITGFATGGAERVRLGALGVGIGGLDPTSTQALRIYHAGDGGLQVVANAGFCDNYIEGYGTGAGRIIGRTAQGSFTSPLVVATNAAALTLIAQAHSGAVFRTIATMSFSVIAAAPSDADMEGQFDLQAAPASSVVSSTLFKGSHGAGLLFTGSAFLTGARHFKFRTYTQATLPTPAANEAIENTDYRAMLTSDGTEWLSPGFVRLRNLAANTTFNVQAGWAIENVYFSNGNANAVTGGIKLGTTSGATDVIAAQAIAGNAIGHVAAVDLLKRYFSRSTLQTVFVQAVTAWNSALVDLTITMRKVM
jgi:hypothetical protein